jgi:hypothetical protein
LEGRARIPRIDSSNDPKVISDQCVASFAVADFVTSDLLIEEKPNESNKYKAKVNKKYVVNLVQFIKDLAPELRTIYIQQIYSTRILNLIMDSGLAGDIIEELIKYIAE